MVVQYIGRNVSVVISDKGGNNNPPCPVEVPYAFKFSSNPVSSCLQVKLIQLLVRTGFVLWKQN